MSSQFPSIPAAALTGTKRGFLTKQGGARHNWKRRFFVLSKTKLFYYKNAEGKKPLGVITLDADCKVGISSYTYKRNCFRIEHTSKRTYHLVADTTELLSQWVKVIEEAIKEAKGEDSKTKSGPSPSASTITSAQLIDGILKKGYLLKQGFSHKSWKSRLMELHRNIIVYFVDDKQSVMKGCIPLDECRVEDVDGSSEKVPGKGIKISHPLRRTFFLVAKDEEERNNWLGAIRDAVLNPEAVTQNKTNGTEQTTKEEKQEHNFTDSLKTVNKKGLLFKKVTKRDSWSKRWFVLKDNVLYHMNTQKDFMPKKAIELTGYQVSKTSASISKREFAFEVVHPQHEVRYLLEAENEQDRIEWLEALQDASQKATEACIELRKKISAFRRDSVTNTATASFISAGLQQSSGSGKEMKEREATVVQDGDKKGKDQTNAREATQKSLSAQSTTTTTTTTSTTTTTTTTAASSTPAHSSSPSSSSSPSQPAKEVDNDSNNSSNAATEGEKNAQKEKEDQQRQKEKEMAV